MEFPGDQCRPATAVSLPGYFQQRLSHTADQRGIATSEHTIHYLSHLMTRFAHSDQLFEYDRGYFGLRPLALLYADAYQAPTDRERCLLLQRLGDLALFIGALFPERYARRGIRRDYFVGMGGGAYGYLSDRAPVNRSVFGELAVRFAPMLELLGAVGRLPQHGETPPLSIARRRGLN